jgi:hypothetical protein
VVSSIPFQHQQRGNLVIALQTECAVNSIADHVKKMARFDHKSCHGQIRPILNRRHPMYSIRGDQRLESSVWVDEKDPGQSRANRLF